MGELGGVRVSGNHQGGLNSVVSLIQSTDLLSSCAVLALWEKSSTKGNSLTSTFVLRGRCSDPCPSSPHPDISLFNLFLYVPASELEIRVSYFVNE